MCPDILWLEYIWLHKIFRNYLDILNTPTAKLAHSIFNLLAETSMDPRAFMQLANFRCFLFSSLHFGKLRQRALKKEKKAAPLSQRRRRYIQLEGGEENKRREIRRKKSLWPSKISFLLSTAPQQHFFFIFSLLRPQSCWIAHTLSIHIFLLFIPSSFPSLFSSIPFFLSLPFFPQIKFIEIITCSDESGQV